MKIQIRILNSRSNLTTKIEFEFKEPKKSFTGSNFKLNRSKNCFRSEKWHLHHVNFFIKNCLFLIEKNGLLQDPSIKVCFRSNMKVEFVNFAVEFSQNWSNLLQLKIKFEVEIRTQNWEFENSKFKREFVRA